MPVGQRFQPVHEFTNANTKRFGQTNVHFPEPVHEFTNANTKRFGQTNVHFPVPTALQGGTGRMPVLPSTASSRLRARTMQKSIANKSLVCASRTVFQPVLKSPTRMTDGLVRGPSFPIVRRWAIGSGRMPDLFNGTVPIPAIPYLSPLKKPCLRRIPALIERPVFAILPAWSTVQKNFQKAVRGPGPFLL